MFGMKAFDRSDPVTGSPSNFSSRKTHLAASISGTGAGYLGGGGRARFCDLFYDIDSIDPEESICN